MSIVVRIWTVAEQLHDDPRVHVLGQQQDGGGVPAVVQADVPDAGGLQQAGRVVLVGLLVDRPWGWAKTRSSSRHSEPASIRSPSCAAWCRCSSATSGDSPTAWRGGDIGSAIPT